MAGAYAAVAAAAAAAASSATGVGAGVVVSSPCSSLSMPSFSSSSTTATTSSIHYPRIGLTDLEAAGCSSPTTGLQNGSSSVFSQSVHQLATIHSPPQHPLGQSLRVSISNSASSINPTSNNVASTMQPGYHLPLSMRQSGYPGVTGRQASTFKPIALKFGFAAQIDQT
ncbi:unnamed protein product [Protopolystoma xenopodis]|uniref:Uncharacterized protein n=1 Tax=Protopolystoma xenopodis TaxID=117903 RepID=A0A3S5CKP4_9PLAT|nr:unnamed protein product [Protopolystoma xenopodis]